MLLVQAVPIVQSVQVVGKEGLCMLWFPVRRNPHIPLRGPEPLAEARSRVIVKPMKKTKSKQREAQDSAVRQPLQELRDALLDLHKVLIDSERAVYETNVGPIKSPHHFFQLVSSDPWFAWLR